MDCITLPCARLRRSPLCPSGRRKAGLTQEELAEGICSLQALSRIETGVSGVRHDYKGDA
ncbi:helix-turn-helix transcriptional regulator [Acetatifactor aquisgranensis]|uniref:helix-turn-helix transcriptional regulator n=1 Tax=Acetatifactor aquisgranensis TaxID=2941233 RepID=UPI002ED4CB4D